MVSDIFYAEFNQLQVGQAISVWYAPATPEKNVTRPELVYLEAGPNRLLFPILAIALFAWGVARIRRRAPPAQA